MTSRPSSSLFPRGSWAEASRVTTILRKETVGGVLLLVAAVSALVWANSPWSDSYIALREFTVGPQAWHLALPLGTWAADGLLAIFFFVVGLELKREFVAGEQRDPRRAVVPIAAAIGGMAVPAIIFVAINLRTGDDALRAWAVPTATDTAFALAILAAISTHLPSSLRTFLLTLAVVDDLLAITIIAVFYTDSLSVAPLFVALAPLAAFTIAVQNRILSWWLLTPLACATWVLVHASGVHATVAGLALGFAVPVLRRHHTEASGTSLGLAEHFERQLRPLSAGFAVPVFAFFAAGVTIGGLSGLTNALSHPIAIGIVGGLVLGKAIGIFGTTFLVSRFTRATLDSGLRWIDVLGLSMLAGIGFTVSLLVGELAFGLGSPRDDLVKIGVLTGSVIAAVCAAVVLRLRNRTYRLIIESESESVDNGH